MKKFRITWLIIVILVTVLFLGYRINEIRKADSSGPVFSCKEDSLEISIEDGDEALLQGITASDKKDGDVTDSVLVEKLSAFYKDGSRIVTYAAFDSDNHISEMERKITYTDYRSPRFELTGSLRFRAGETVNVDQIVKASDCLDGDISNKVKILMEDVINNRVTGFYEIRYQVSNSAGDTVTLPVEVEVYEAVSNEVELNLDRYLIYYEGEEIDYKSFLKSVRTGNIETPFEGVLLDGMGSQEEPATSEEEMKPEETEEEDTEGEEPVEGQEETTAGNGAIPRSRVTIRSQVNTSVPGVYPVYYYYSDMQEGYERVAEEVLYVVVEE